MSKIRTTRIFLNIYKERICDSNSATYLILSNFGAGFLRRLDLASSDATHDSSRLPELKTLLEDAPPRPARERQHPDDRGQCLFEPWKRTLDAENKFLEKKTPPLPGTIRDSSDMNYGPDNSAEGANGRNRFGPTNSEQETTDHGKCLFLSIQAIRLTLKNLN
ncbi:hypothetical protein AAG570_008677 [Ranatra chinensis]|uniref:Uncharacterized protein n=1 Tax=Ranatra chinensis TaxID=642074 RepID=A0ABD0ZEW6_9HEMI